MTNIGLMLGSGWHHAVNYFGEPIGVGLYQVGENRVTTFQRHHLYESGDVHRVAMPVTNARNANCDVLVQTNAVGGINYPAGQVMVIKDHINLTGVSPLRGFDFVNMSDAYDLQLQQLAIEKGADARGVYAQLRGPQYETPAEIKMLQGLGADVVGMSTALETIQARSLGMRVLALSLISNFAADYGHNLSHEEVLATGKNNAKRLGTLLAEILAAI